MGPYDGLTPEERARITEIQDFLIDRYVEQKEALDKGDDTRAKEIGREIKELQREKEEIKEWAAT
jgi:benzoyl-CoA reductase/2-hydroxyglutaryl-CoA dehydratase subunit BcrC/BadD/HgdB